MADRLARVATLIGIALAGAIVVVLARRAYGTRQVTDRLRREYVSYRSGAERAIEPSIAAAGARVAVAWMSSPARDPTAPATAIGTRISRDGSRWSDAMEVRAPEGRFVADPVLTGLRDGSILLTFLAFRSRQGSEAYDMRVYATLSGPGSVVFGPVESVTSDQPNREYDRPWAVETRSGALVVVYRAAFAGVGAIEVARAPSAVSLRFERATLHGGAGFGGGLAIPCASTDSGRVFVAYFDPLRGILLRASDDEGASFPVAREVLVSLPGENVALEAPSCVAAGDGALIAYGVGRSPVDTGASPAVDVSVVDTRVSSAGRRAVAVPGHALYHPRILSEHELVAIVSKDGEATAGIAVISVSGARTPITGAQPIAPRRSDPSWCGDYFGAVAVGDEILVASCDAASGIPQVVFSRARRARD